MEVMIALMLSLLRMVRVWIAARMLGTVLALIVDLMNRCKLFRAIATLMAMTMASDIL
jgi:hypothetical protein